MLAAAAGESVPYYRRCHPRTPCDLAVELQLGFFRRLRGRAVDVGEGGMRVVTLPALQLDTAIGIRLELPGGDRLKLRGQVISVTASGPGKGAGIAFLFASARQRAAAAAAVAMIKSATP